MGKKKGPRKLLLFLVDDRTKETLIPKIRDNTIEGSLVFSDEWKAYNCLSDLDFHHLTVCHKYRFRRYHFDGRVVTRVTTNHIERAWVEVRKTTEKMTPDDLEEFLHLESFRQLKLVHKKVMDNVEEILRLLPEFGPRGADFMEFGTDD